MGPRRKGVIDNQFYKIAMTERSKTLQNVYKSTTYVESFHFESLPSFKQIRKMAKIFPFFTYGLVGWFGGWAVAWLGR